MGAARFWRLLWCAERWQRAESRGSHSLTGAWPLLIHRQLPYLCLELLELIHMQSAHWLWLSFSEKLSRAAQQEEKWGQGLQSTGRCLQGSPWNVVFNHHTYWRLCNTAVKGQKIKPSSKGTFGVSRRISRGDHEVRARWSRHTWFNSGSRIQTWWCDSSAPDILVAGISDAESTC